MKSRKLKNQRPEKALPVSFLIFLLLSFVFLDCAPAPRFYHSRPEESQELPREVYQIGIASYYGRELHGRKTASGEVFDMFALTCAHPELPFGTRIKVTNLDNGRWVIVRVNDRGPFAADRVLDLSCAAAKKIGMIATGTARVKIEIVGGR